MYLPFVLGDPILYWTLRLILLITFVVCGYGISFDKKNNYYKYAIPAGLVYSLIEGLRWNRGQDYYHYYGDLVGRLFTDDYEIGYLFIVNVLTEILNLPFWMCFILYSALLITAFLSLFKLFPKAAVWALPLFYIITESSSENLIRQWLAIPFVILGYYQYSIGNWKKCLLSLFVVPCIHMSGLFAVTMFLLFAKVKIQLKTPWILLGIFLLFYFFWDASYFSFVTELLNDLNLGDDTKFSGYVENADRWFTEEGSINNVLGKTMVRSMGIINLIAKFSAEVLLIIYGFKTCSKDSRLLIPFYFAYIALLLSTISGDIEIYARFAEWLNYFTPFVWGLVLGNKDIRLKEKYVIYTIVVIQYVFYGFIRMMGSIPYKGCAFIWDA